MWVDLLHPNIVLQYQISKMSLPQIAGEFTLSKVPHRNGIDWILRSQFCLSGFHSTLLILGSALGW